MAHSVYYFDKTNRRYEGRKRICQKCGKEEVVRANNSGQVCQSCIRPFRDVIYFSKGKKYPGRNKICKDCGKHEIVRLSNKSEYCFHCVAKHKRSCVKDDELFIQRNANRRQRAHREICERCGKERLVRNDTRLKSRFCHTCYTSIHGIELGKKYGPLTYKNGIGGYRNKAFNFFKKECFCCGTIDCIKIHHVDENRCNNEINNLMPVCNSCHRMIHNYLRQNKKHNIAIGLIRMRKKLSKHTNEHGNYIK